MLSTDNPFTDSLLYISATAGCFEIAVSLNSQATKFSRSRKIFWKNRRYLYTGKFYRQRSRSQYRPKHRKAGQPLDSPVIKGAIHSQLNRAILLCDVIPNGKTE